MQVLKGQPNDHVHADISELPPPVEREAAGEEHRQADEDRIEEEPDDDVHPDDGSSHTRHPKRHVQTVEQAERRCINNERDTRVPHPQR